MQKINQAIQLSASDLVGHLNCRNLTELDIGVAKGMIAKPKVWNPFLDGAARTRTSPRTRLCRAEPVPEICTGR
jgi:hypothetical protein